MSAPDQTGPRGTASGALRVVQLNAGSLFEGGWEARRVEVVRWLERLDADIVCLEEIWAAGDEPSTAHWIADALPGRATHVAFGGRPFKNEIWPDPKLRFGSAVISRWPIDAVTYHSLPVAPGATGFVVGVPWEALHVRTAGLDVFACHLAAAPTDGLHRQQQVLALDAIVRAGRGDRDADVRPGTRRDSMPAIICGDFNAEPDSDEVRFLTSLTALDGRTTFYQDAWRVAGNTTPGFTNDWVTHPLAAGLNVHRKRIDYVFVGDPFLRTGDAGRVLRADLAFDEPLTGVQASDHTGLVVDIVWPGRPHA